MVFIMQYSAGEKFYSSIVFAIIGGVVSFILIYGPKLFWIHRDFKYPSAIDSTLSFCSQDSG